jgi:hypothetical protein
MRRFSPRSSPAVESRQGFLITDKDRTQIPEELDTDFQDFQDATGVTF